MTPELIANITLARELLEREGYGTLKLTGPEFDEAVERGCRAEADEMGADWRTMPKDERESWLRFQRIALTAALEFKWRP